MTGDPWDGRTLEWSIPSPAPLYNFARLPQVTSQDEWWEEKQRIASGEPAKPLAPLEPIHMPKNSSIPFIMSFCWFIAGFGFVWDWLWMAIPGYDRRSHMHACPFVLLRYRLLYSGG